MYVICGTIYEKDRVSSCIEGGQIIIIIWRGLKDVENELINNKYMNGVYIHICMLNGSADYVALFLFRKLDYGTVLGGMLCIHFLCILNARKYFMSSSQGHYFFFHRNNGKRERIIVWKMLFLITIFIIYFYWVHYMDYIFIEFCKSTIYIMHACKNKW